MEKELYDYITSKLEELHEYSIDVPMEVVMDVYHKVLNHSCSFVEKKKIVDEIVSKVIDSNKKKQLNEMAKKGEYSNFDQIKEVLHSIMHSPLAPYVTIYGGTVPYLITGKSPKRIIGDIDLFASVEDMPKIREIIKEHPELFKVVLDSKDYAGDYGMELKVNGVDVTIFTHEYTPEGRIVRNFKEDIFTNSIDVQAILFYGIFDEELTIEVSMGDVLLKLECPEYVYIQKSIALREKDQMDIEVLKDIIDEEKLEHLKKTSNVPKVLESHSVNLDEKKSQVRNSSSF